MATETGESTAAIHRRLDLERWPRVEAALLAGAVLYRPARLTSYYTRCADDRDDNNGIGLTATFVKQLEREGKIRRVGVDTYQLAEVADAVTA